MLSDVILILRNSCRALLTSNAPGQLAAGFTIGMIIGFVPKGNLIALSLCVLMFSLRCNKGIGLAAAVIFSFAGPWTDPLAHRLGFIVLNWHSGQATYASIFNLPLGPWLGLENTVVVGSLMMGLYVAYPVFWFTRLFFKTVWRLPAEAAV